MDLDGALRKATNVRKMLWRKFKKNKSNYNWEIYRKQRNKVTCMRKNSKCNFIKSKCTSMKNGGEFWQTVGPFISNKTKEDTSDIVLTNDETIVSDKLKVCSILNDYFASVAKDIGNATRPLSRC